MLWQHLSHVLYERSSLLKFSERGCMEPDVFSIGFHFLTQCLNSGTLSKPHLFYFRVEVAVNTYCKLIYVYENVVHGERRECRFCSLALPFGVAESVRLLKY